MVTGQPCVPPWRRRFTVAASLLLACGASVFAAACGSTSVTNLTGPDVVRCAASLTANPATVPPGGATVSVAVAAARDCAWTARSDAAWLQVRSTSGQGDGTFTATAASNDQASARSGGIVVNDQRLGITQEGRGCSIDVSGASEPIGPSGGRRALAVSSLPGCTWTAESSVPWVVVVNGSGSGSGTVVFDVQANTGATREASITVGSRAYLVAQAAAPTAPPCTFTIDRAAEDFPVLGGQASVTVTTQPACSWNVEGGSSWTAILAGSGTGGGDARYVVGPNISIVPRTTALTIAGRVHTITQQGVICTVTLTPGSRAFAAAGGAATLSVNTQAGCPWTASSNSGWTGLTTFVGSGPGELGYVVQPNPDLAARTALIAIGGQTHTVQQSGAAPPCSYSIDSASHSFAAAAAAFTVRITTQAGCGWGASSNVPWATLAQSDGAGPFDLSYSVSANASPTPRSGTLTIAGHPHVVNQEAATPACTYALTPETQAFGALGGPGVVRVTTGPACTWMAASSEAWVSVSTADGVGTFDVAYTVAPMATGGNRTATITVNGQGHTVTQSGPVAAPP